MPTIQQMREKAAEDAMLKLKHEVIPALETVIAGTPTGTLRDMLTTVNIDLHNIAEGRVKTIEPLVR
jgi:hypothetical protein